MDLPQIQMIGLQTPQRLFQLPHRHIFAASMRAYLRHHKRLVPFALQRRAQPFFTYTVVVFPAVIEKIDACIQRSRHQLQ